MLMQLQQRTAVTVSTAHDSPAVIPPLRRLNAMQTEQASCAASSIFHHKLMLHAALHAFARIAVQLHGTHMCVMSKFVRSQVPPG
jgi:hypothetical protein